MAEDSTYRAFEQALRRVDKMAAPERSAAMRTLQLWIAWAEGKVGELWRLLFPGAG